MSMIGKYADQKDNIKFVLLACQMKAANEH